MRTRAYEKHVAGKQPLSSFSTWRLFAQTDKFLLVRSEFFGQPILTNHGAGFFFSLRVARTESPSGKRALFSQDYDTYTSDLVNI